MTASDSKRDARGLAQGVLSYARKNVRTIAVLLAALVFVWLLEEVSEGEIMTLDALAYRFFVVTLRSDVMTPSWRLHLAFVRGRDLGDGAGGGRVCPGQGAGALRLRQCGGALVLNQVLKFIVQSRGRTGTGWRWRAATAFPRDTR